MLVAGEFVLSILVSGLTFHRSPFLFQVFKMRGRRKLSLICLFGPQKLASFPVNLFGFTGSAVGLGANEFDSDRKALASAILNEKLI